MTCALLFNHEPCGLIIAEIGPTFHSEYIKVDGEIYGSSLDHVYFSSDLEKKIMTKTINNSSSDHYPVTCELRSIPKILPHTRSIRKRSMINFSEAKWNDTIENRIGVSLKM